MNSYERRCRWLLSAFPADFRRDRGQDLITTLLDDAPPGARSVSPSTAVNLITSGVRMRALRAGAGGSIRAGLAGGLELAGLLALGVQAALAVASAVFDAEHGMVFYLPPALPGQSALGSQTLITWVLLAVASWAAFAAAVRGAWRLAAGLATAASAYTVIVAEHAVLTVYGGPFIDRTGDIEFVATPGLLAIGVLAAVLTVFTALRQGQGPRGQPRCLWWLPSAGLLGLLFSILGDGDAVQAPPPNFAATYPPQGGIMTAFQYLFAAAVIIGVVWSRYDPRVGWAVAALTVPFIVHQISDLTIGDQYYGRLYQPGWETALPLIAASFGLILLTASAATTSLRLRRR